MNLIKQYRATIMRIFWFGIGGVLSIFFNAGLFRLLTAEFRWNRYLAYAVSLAAVNVLLFVWNYFVGFRTSAHWTVAARRQVVCIGSSNLLNYALVMVLQSVFPRWPEAVIAAVQILIAGFKFLLYHYWVYPAPAAPMADSGGAFFGGAVQRASEDC
jgi:putative flippase GtrA